MSTGARRIQAGDELPSWETPVITPELIRKYAEASGDFNQIHIDPEYARKAGHPGVIAHGMWSVAQLANLVQRWAGTSFIRESRARFVGVMPAGECLTCRARVRAVREDGLVEIEAWTERPDGRRTTEALFVVDVPRAT